MKIFNFRTAQPRAFCRFIPALIKTMLLANFSINGSGQKSARLPCMKVTRFDAFRQKPRIPAGLLLIVLVGSVEAWMIWRLGVEALRALDEHEKAVRLPVPSLPYNGATN